MGRRLLWLVALTACSKPADPPAQRDPEPTSQPKPVPTPSPAIDAAFAERPPGPARPDAGIPKGPGGSMMLTNGFVRSYNPGPGFLYWCEGHIFAAPKSYGIDVDRGPCEQGTMFEADATGMLFCDSRGVSRLPPEGPAELIHPTPSECFLEGADADSIYYIIPAFEGVANPGLYRVARTGGTATKLLPHRMGEQATAVPDGDHLWVRSNRESWFLKRMPRGGGARTTVIGERMEEFVFDDVYLYWTSATMRDLRRRKKTGGPIDVIVRDIYVHHLRRQGDRLYWFQADPDGSERLMLLRSGALVPGVVLSGLRLPAMQVDADGIYFSQVDELGVFMLPHPP